MIENCDNAVVQFLQFLSRGGSYGCYTQITDGFAKNDIWSCKDPINPPLDKENVYFRINPLKERPVRNSRGAEKSTGAVNCLYSDFDSKDFNGDLEKTLEHIKTLISPSIIVFSGHGYHAYWLFTEPYVIMNEEDLQHIKKVQNHWVTYYTHGDDHAKDLARILRLPQTYNVKLGREKVLSQFVEFDLDKLYSLQDLEGLIQIPEVRRKHTANKKSDTTYQNIPIRLLRRDPSPIVWKIKDAIKGTLKGKSVEVDSKHHYKSRSEAEAAMVTILIFDGLDYDEIHSFFETYTPNHYKEIPSTQRNNYLSELFMNLLNKICNNPNRMIIEKIYKKVSAYRFEGRTGNRDKSILLAVLAKCYEFGTFVISLSEREIIEYTQYNSPDTIRNGINALKSAGVIDCAFEYSEKQNRNETRFFEITQLANNDELLTNSINGYVLDNYWSDIPQKSESWRTNPLWKHSFLGKNGQLIYSLLNEEIYSVKELRQKSGLDRGTIVKKLHLLEDLGLVKKYGKGWGLGTENLEVVAKKLRCDGLAEKQRQKHKSERKKYRQSKQQISESIEKRNNKDEHEFETPISLTPDNNLENM